MEVAHKRIKSGGACLSAACLHQPRQGAITWQGKNRPGDLKTSKASATMEGGHGSQGI